MGGASDRSWLAPTRQRPFAAVRLLAGCGHVFGVSPQRDGRASREKPAWLHRVAWCALRKRSGQGVPAARPARGRRRRQRLPVADILPNISPPPGCECGVGSGLPRTSRDDRNPAADGRAAAGRWHLRHRRRGPPSETWRDRRRTWGSPSSPAPLSGRSDTTRCGALRCREREASAPEKAPRWFLAERSSGNRAGSMEDPGRQVAPGNVGDAQILPERAAWITPGKEVSAVTGARRP